MARRSLQVLVIAIAMARVGDVSAFAPSQTAKDDEASIVRALIDWILVPANNGNAPRGTAGVVLITETACVCAPGAPPTGPSCITGRLIDALRDRCNYTAKYSFVPDALAAAFLERNAQPHALADPSRAGVVLLSLVDLRAVFGVGPQAAFDGWDAFHKRFPGVSGYLKLSATAFDADRRHALVYVGYQYGNVGGVGRLVLLVRGDTDWQVERSALIWIS